MLWGLINDTGRHFYNRSSKLKLRVVALLWFWPSYQVICNVISLFSPTPSWPCQSLGRWMTFQTGHHGGFNPFMPAALLFLPFIKMMVMMMTMTMMIRMIEMMMTVPRISPMIHLVFTALCFSFLQKVFYGRSANCNFKGYAPINLELIYRFSQG